MSRATIPIVSNTSRCRRRYGRGRHADDYSRALYKIIAEWRAICRASSDATTDGDAAHRSMMRAPH